MQVELPHPFYWAAPDALRGDWQGEGYVAQVIPAQDRIFSMQDLIPQQEEVGHDQANIFRKFDLPNDKPVAVLQHITRTPPTLGAKPPGGAVEVVPRSGGLISLYIQDRHEANINEMCGRLGGNPCAGFDNSTPADARPGIRCSRPPLEWQTMDIDFHAPRFDAAGNKTAVEGKKL